MIWQYHSPSTKKISAGRDGRDGAQKQEPLKARIVQNWRQEFRGREQDEGSGLAAEL